MSGAGPAPGAPGGAVGGDRVAAVTADLRDILAAVSGRPELADCPAEAPLFGSGVGLDSLTGTLLLREIRQRYGVDVAAEDLNLDSLASLGSLATFVAGRAPVAGPPGPAG